MSDDLRRKILYRTYLSHQKGSCIEKTPSCDPVFSPGPACIIQHKIPSGVFPNRILGIWGVVRPGTTVGAKKGEHTHSLRGLLLVREPGPPELPAFADLPHEPSSGACHADQPLDSDCALGHQELVLIDLLAALSHRTDFSVGCYCPEESRCHRSVLRALLAERGAKLI